MWRMENMQVDVRYKPFYRTQLVFGERETFVTGSLYSPYRLCKRARLDKDNRERGDVRSMAGEKHEQAFGEEVKQAAEGEREMQIDTNLANLRHDWSDLYGNQPGTLQIVRAEGPTGEEVPAVASYGLEDGAGLADVLDRAHADAARDRAEA